MEEVSLLLYINHYVREKEFDVILLDCAPTGESIRFISVPTTLDWYIKKIFKMEKTLAKVVGPVAKRIYNVPIPGDEYFDAIEHLFERLRGVDQLMIDPEVTSVRLIANPEKIVIKETQRAFMYFGLYGFTVDAVIVNRLLPPMVGEGFFDKWRKTQALFLAEAKRYFDPVPIWTVPLKDDQVVGVEGLAELGRALYEGADPAASFRTTAPYRYQKRPGHYLLTLDLPFAEREDVELAVASGDLIVTLGNFRHHIPIPRTLSGHVPTKAKVEAGRLTVRFERAGEEAHVGRETGQAR